MRVIALIFTLVAMLGLASSVFAGGKPVDIALGVHPFTVRATPILRFRPRDDATRFGALEFRDGLELHASTGDFGGISGLSIDQAGERLVAISDAGLWVTGRFRELQGRLVGVDDLEMAPMVGATGKALMRSRRGDAESLVLSGGTAYVGIERSNEIMRFPFARNGVTGRGERVLLPAAARRLPRGRGFEAIGVGLPGTPLAGTLVAIAEGGGDDDAPTQGFLIGGRAPGSFKLTRSKGYDITDIAFLPDGDFVVLERRFSPLGGIGMRMRRIAAADVRPGSSVDGEVLVDVAGDCVIDNMEALAISRTAGGDVIFTVMSDDNFSFLQRNLILRFTLVDRGT